MDRLFPLAFTLMGILATAQSASAESYQGNEGVVYACVRDGRRMYTSRPLPTDSACRAIKYSWVDDHSARSDPPGTFMGYRCSSDCSGHKAGYAWAAKQGTSSVQNCRGRSKSFVEGCMAYVASRTGQGGR